MLSCHYKNKLFEVINLLVLLFGVVGVLFGVLGEEFGLENEACALLFLAVCAFAAGKIMHAIIRMPELLGMLLVGISFRYFISFNVSVMWSSTIRDCALTVILLKAGLGLDPVKLSKLKLAILKLSLLPSISEAVAVTVSSRFLLQLPWMWSLMLGFIICAVSAAVLVPGMMDLDEKQYGREKGISTLMLASVSVDNAFALAGFFVSMSILTSQKFSAMSLMKKAVEPFIGLLLGGVFGLLMWWIPSMKSQTYKRALFLCVGGLNFMFLSKRFNVAGAGALGCISYTFISSLRWRQDISQFNALVDIIGVLWKILEIFLFSLIGIQVTLDRLGQNLGVGLAILFIGISIRFISTMAALCGTNTNFKEKIFISASWASKATVQAAVGSIALEHFQGRNTEEQFGKEVLSLSVLSILLTAPLGSLVIEHLGPHLLRNTEESSPLLSSNEAQITRNQGSS